MLIDCDSCVARDIACRDCVVTVLLGGPPARTEPGEAVALDDAERGALDQLAAAGLVPPLRVVPYATPGPDAVTDVFEHSDRPPGEPGIRGIA